MSQALFDKNKIGGNYVCWSKIGRMETSSSHRHPLDNKAEEANILSFYIEKAACEDSLGQICDEYVLKVEWFVGNPEGKWTDRFYYKLGSFADSESAKHYACYALLCWQETMSFKWCPGVEDLSL